MLLTVFLMLALTVIFAASMAEGSALLIAGVVAPILAQFVKRMFGASSLAALAVTLVVATLVALAGMYVAGQIHSAGDVLKQIMAVFGIATLIYKLFTAAETNAA